MMKREATGEILSACQSFEGDEMIRARDVQYGKAFLPRKRAKKTDNQLGLRDPKSDYIINARVHLSAMAWMKGVGETGGS